MRASLILAPRMAGFGAERKAMLRSAASGFRPGALRWLGFRFCPIADPPHRSDLTRLGEICHSMNCVRQAAIEGRYAAWSRLFT
jgi:hypothetical protein